MKGRFNMPDFGIVSIPAIVVIAYLAGSIVKNYTPLENNKILPIVGIVGGICGVVGFHILPDFPAQDVMTAAAVGIVSGMASTWVDQTVKKVTNK